MEHASGLCIKDCPSYSALMPIVLSVFRGRIFRRGAKADENFEERDGSLSVHRQQRGSARGQQTYLYQRSL